MPDPLDVLRAPIEPVDPDPGFAAHLRARLERALTLPNGVIPMTATPAAEPSAGPAALTPYLAVADARAAIDWYVATLGAREVGEPIVMLDGRIGHAELAIAGARMYLADEHPEIGVSAPAPGAGATVTLHLEVADVDAVIARAARADARVEREPADYPYGRLAMIRDPFGHRWMLESPPTEPADRMRGGDVGYFSLCVEDVDRAADFYAAVLGWTYVEDGGSRRTVTGRPFPYRINAVGEFGQWREFWSHVRTPTVFCSYGVADLDAAVARVRAAGGRASDPEDTPHGRGADCVDDQGAPFSLHEPAPDTRRPAPNGERSGDVAYLTMQVADSAAARAFYGTLFGWTFTPGRVEEGWDVEGPAPMTGLHGGHAHAVNVPMYRVDDVEAAVRRVRAAGGTATEPQRRPYGVTAECTDDQGLTFYLGQL